MQTTYDMVIVGAGMAGLSAARALAERGHRPLLLEAQSRAGGRILTRHVAGNALETGAEFLHGRPPELWALIAEAGLEPVARRGSMLRESAPGHLIADEEGADVSTLEELEHLTGPDITFAEWLATTALPTTERAALTGYVEGFNAADANRISARSLGIQQRAEDASGGGQSWHLPSGYDGLIRYLAERCAELDVQLRLNCAVSAIRWAKGVAHLETSEGPVTARRVLLTVPLGVLQQVNRPNCLAIDPEPAAIGHARRMAMGHAVRVSLLFRERWWEAVHPLAAKLSFLFTPARTLPVWWASPPEAGAILTGWAGGPRTAALAGRSTSDIETEAMHILAEVFSVTDATLRSDLLHTAFHDWDRDPFSQGAYSYVAAGAVDASAAMTQPEADTLFFAGEHTDVTGHWGTVHAALRSGLRAARQMLGE